MTPLYQWKKTVTARRADDWQQRIEPAVPADRLAVVTPVNGLTRTFEVYFDSESEASGLVRQFGGRTRKVAVEDWLPAPATAPGRPFAFGRQLLVTGRAEELAALRADNPRRHVLGIPAAMAFGTGEHATTAMCLRLLGEVSIGLRAKGPWTLLDLGTGSGVLALAARMFGATHATGWDNDPHAVRTARENAALNGIDHTTFRQLDLLSTAWPSNKTGGWPIITANLFSELLISVLPRTAAALQANGQLIASGILASQAAEVEAALAAHGLALIAKRHRSRWVAFLAQKCV